MHPLPSTLVCRPPGVHAPRPASALHARSPAAYVGSHNYAAASFAEVAAFNRSEVAERIRRSFDAMVARSPMGAHMVSCCWCG